MCIGASDCASNFCNDISCVATHCLDKKLDDDETDVDCGGAACAGCAVGLSCGKGADCTSTFCNASTKKCVTSHCGNGVKDADESDVDCGGATCAKCPTGKGCGAAADCTSGYCNVAAGTCASDHCVDAVKDADETDVDCGGATCAKCAAGKMCSGAADCAPTLSCVPHVTGAPPICACGELLATQYLAQGASSAQVSSCDGRFTLVMQTDGNLVHYWNGMYALWSSNTTGTGATRVVMQDDGNLVVYDAFSTGIWSSVTAGYPGAHLAVQNDGDLVVYSAGLVVWSSGTGGH